MPLGLIAVTQSDGSAGAGSTFSGQASITPTTIGDFLLVMISWYSASSTISNSAETSGSVVTLTVSNNSYTVGQTVALAGLTAATWLNGLTVTLLVGTTGTSLVFNDPTTHGTKASGSDTGTASPLAQGETVTALSDTQTNTYAQIGTTQYSTNVHGGSVGVAIYYTVAKATTSLSYSWTLSAAFATNHINVNDWGPQVFTPFVDTFSTFTTGSTTAVSTSTFTPIINHDALFLLGVSNSTNTIPAISPLTQALDGSGTNGNFIQYYPFIGVGIAPTETAPYSFSGTLSAAADWITVLVGVVTTSPEGLAQGDTAESSAGNFQQFKELYFQGDIFLEGYVGLLFLKNVFVLPRDYWDKALSTPYSGQLFPVGPGEGGPGQIYPY